jgi:hypothetical protein
MSDGPFIDEIAPLDQLRAEYINNDNKLFVKQIDYLWGQGYHIRRTKGTLLSFMQRLQLRPVQAMVAAFIDVRPRVHFNTCRIDPEQPWRSHMSSSCWKIPDAWTML